MQHSANPSCCRACVRNARLISSGCRSSSFVASQHTSTHKNWSGWSVFGWSFFHPFCTVSRHNITQRWVDQYPKGDMWCYRLQAQLLALIRRFLSSKMQEILINDQLIKSVMTLCLLAVVRKRRPWGVFQFKFTPAHMLVSLQSSLVK